MGTFQKISELLQSTTKIKEELKCQNCGRLLKEYNGKFGKFIGCPNFQSDEGCRSTYSIENKEEIREL